MSFDFDWPWLGATCGLVLLALLFGTSLFRSTPVSTSRWHDVRWLAVLAAPVYAAHQFEEHGIDLFGVVYAFQGSFCSELGFSDLATCPAQPSFLTADNVGSVWGAIALAALFGRGRPIVSLSGYSIPFVNAFTHIAGGVALRAYNPGLLTAVLLLLPASAWALAEGRRQGIGRSGVAAIIGGGVAVHAVLLGSLLALSKGWIESVSADGLQIVNAAVPLIFVLVVTRVGSARRKSDRK